MAHYTGGYYANRMRKRIWVYASLAVVVVAVVFVFVRKPKQAPPPLQQGPADSEPVAQGPEITGADKVEAEPKRWPRLQEPLLTEEAIAALGTDPNSSASPEVTDVIRQAQELITATPSKVIEARDILNNTLPLTMTAQQRAVIKAMLWRADRWLFNKSIFPPDMLCGSYTVKPGDLLRSIAKDSKVPYEILQRINNISDPRKLQAGQHIKIINGPFHARIHRSTFSMDLFLQDTYVRSFEVGLGKPEMETPTGLWLVKPGGKLVKPTWTDRLTNRTYKPDDPDYPLGSRWIGLEGVSGQALGREGFAIHGTKDPNTIGTLSSQGCIRLNNGDAILMYDLLMPGHSKVEVVD